jgi:hypothetical protein
MRSNRHSMVPRGLVSANANKEMVDRARNVHYSVHGYRDLYGAYSRRQRDREAPRLNRGIGLVLVVQPARLEDSSIRVETNDWIAGTSVDLGVKSTNLILSADNSR